MEAFNHYMPLISYPIAMAIFTYASAEYFIRTKNIYSLLCAIGFLATLSGYLLQNFGPHNIKYTLGGAIVQYTWAFTTGRYLAIAGIVVAAIGFHKLLKQHGST